MFPAVPRTPRDMLPCPSAAKRAGPEKIPVPEKVPGGEVLPVAGDHSDAVSGCPDSRQGTATAEGRPEGPLPSGGKRSVPAGEQRAGDRTGRGTFALMLVLSLLVHGLVLWRSPDGTGPSAGSARFPASVSVSFFEEAPAAAPAPPPRRNLTPSGERTMPPEKRTPVPSRSPSPSRAFRAVAGTPPPRPAPDRAAASDRVAAPDRAAVSEGAGSGSASAPGGASSPGSAVRESRTVRRAVFGAVDGPGFLRAPVPQYPRAALRRRLGGEVLLELTLEADGRLLGVSVLKSAGHGFDEAALEAVRRARFRPAIRNGRPEACIVLLPVHFRPRNTP